MAQKMDQRDFRFDYLRCIAIIGIVMCHYLVLWPETKQIGRLFAMTFNNLFVLISAMLIGMKYMGRSNALFLKKRYCKLSYSYYPFTIAIIIISLLCGYTIDWKEILRVLIYFNPATLPGCGHLWFVMMILFAYVLFYLFNYLTTLIGGVTTQHPHSNIRRSENDAELCHVEITPFLSN